MVGYTREDALHRHLAELLFSGRPPEESRASLRSLLDNSDVREIVVVRKDRTRIYASALARPTSGESGGILISLRDVTAATYQAQATALETRFRGLLESAPDAMLMVNQDGRILFANAQTERLFGYDRSELLGQPVELLVPEPLPWPPPRPPRPVLCGPAHA
jgi:protein-histidine pros-kinase